MRPAECPAIRHGRWPCICKPTVESLSKLSTEELVTVFDITAELIETRLADDEEGAA